jgi:hypothetical protein
MAGGGATGLSNGARQAQPVGGQTRQTSAPMAEQAQQTAGQVAEQAQQTASQMAEQARQQAASKADSQKERAVDALGTFAQAVRQTGRDLRQQDQTMFADYAEQAAQKVEHAADFLRTRDTSQLLDETQRFARRNPALFLGASFAIGLLAARFFKSSAAPSEYGAYDYPTAQPYGTPSRALQGYGQYRAGPAYGGSTGYDRPTGELSNPSTPTSRPTSGPASPYGASGGYVSAPAPTGSAELSGSTPSSHLDDDDKPSGSDFSSRQTPGSTSQSSSSGARTDQSDPAGRSE